MLMERISRSLCLWIKDKWREEVEELDQMWIGHKMKGQWEVRSHRGEMISEEVRPRVMGKGANQETVTRKAILCMKEKEKGNPLEMRVWGERQ